MICLIRLQVGQTSIFGKIHSEKPQESEFLSNFLAETCRLVNTLSTPFEFRLSVTTDLIEFLNSSKWPQILKTQEKKIRIRPFSFIKKISDLKNGKWSDSDEFRSICFWVCVVILSYIRNYSVSRFQTPKWQRWRVSVKSQWRVSTGDTIFTTDSVVLRGTVSQAFFEKNLKLENILGRTLVYRLWKW
jgi:hypothetical protein